MFGLIINVDIFVWIKIMKIIAKPTTFKISENARKTLSRLADDDSVSLALEAMKRRVETKNIKPSSFLGRLTNIFKTKTQLSVILGQEEKGNFFVTTVKKINDLRFVGDKVSINPTVILEDVQEFDTALLKSKEGMLENLSQFNKNKKMFGFLKKFFS